MAGTREVAAARAALNGAMTITGENLGVAERFNARIYDPFLWLGERLGMARRRGDLLAGASGRVLEIGAGTALNLGHYPDGLAGLVLAEPVEAMARLAERRVERTGSDARVVLATAERLPFPDGSFDYVVSTLVLCTVDDPAQAIAEIRRVLAPGGRLLFIEHLRSDRDRWARWQDRLEGPWAGFAEGCRCNQRTLDLLAAGGLSVTGLERHSWRGMPRWVRPLALGRAEA
jgi:SAM-dependent methyltransferase